MFGPFALLCELIWPVHSFMSTVLHVMDNLLYVHAMGQFGEFLLYVCIKAVWRIIARQFEQYLPYVCTVGFDNFCRMQCEQSTL